MKYFVVPHDPFVGAATICKSEGLLKFLGSNENQTREVITASQTGY